MHVKDREVRLLKSSPSIIVGFFAIALTSPALASAAEPTASSTSDTSSNGSSTGVGNAGSFGIGSGTSDSLSTATATSNGIQDSSTDDSVDSSTTITTVSVQDLQATNTANHVETTAGTGSTAPVLQTGATTLSGSSFANYTGILDNGWNTAPAGIAQAATNIAVNGNVAGK